MVLSMVAWISVAKWSLTLTKSPNGSISQPRRQGASPPSVLARAPPRTAGSPQTAYRGIRAALTFVSAKKNHKRAREPCEIPRRSAPCARGADPVNCRRGFF